MATSGKTIKKNIENHIIKWVLGLISIVFVASLTFYINTNVALAQNVINIEEVSGKIDEIGEIPAINTAKINRMEDQLGSIKNDAAEMKDDFKELRDDFKEFQKEYKDDHDQMMLILIDIKSNQ